MSDPVADDANASDLFVRGIAKYGDFSFSVKQPRSAPPHGGIEAQCRWHKKNDKTGCKRFLRFEDASEEARCRCILLLKHWCNQSRRFSRQRDHIRMPLSPGDLPLESVVLMQARADHPPLSVKTDVELDEEEEAASKIVSKAKAKEKTSAPKTGGASEPKPKAKRAKEKAKPKQKSKSAAAKTKAVAKPSAKAKVAVADGGSSSSSSSDSDSSSSSSSSSSCQQ